MVSCSKQNNPDYTTGFYLSDNGVTIHCDDSLVGQKADINGVIYTKRNRRYAFLFWSLADATKQTYDNV